MEVIKDLVLLIFSKTMELLNIQIPAVGITFLQLFAGIFVVKFSISLANIIFGFGNANKGGNNSKIKVDDRRAEDKV